MKKLIILFAFTGCCDCPEVRIPPPEPNRHYLLSPAYHDAARLRKAYDDSATWAVNQIHLQRTGDSAQYYMNKWKEGYPTLARRQAEIMDSIRAEMP